MKRITFYLVAFFLVAFSWQGMAQTLNQPANWPNADWSVTTILTGGTQDIEADPSVNANFAYDDDDTGNGSHDEIMAESSVIDLTAAHTAGETILTLSGDYVFNNIDSDEYLGADYWDVDASSWVTIIQLANADTASAPSDNYCGGTSEAYTVDLDISGFTATQLSGFKYRFYYNDDMTGATAWNYGFCFSSPTLVSSIPSTCPAPTDLTNSDITDVFARFGWTENGSATQWNAEIKAGADFTPGNGEANYYSTTTSNPFALGSDLLPDTTYYWYVQADCGGGDTSDWVGPVSFTTNPTPPVNDTMAGAIPITPSPEGTVCDASSEFTAHLAGDGTTDSGMDGTCNGTNTGLDVFYTWTATSDALVWSGNAGGPGVVIRDAAGTQITCEQTLQTDSELSGWTMGDDLIIQVYDYGTSDVDVTFCLAEKMLPVPPANDDACNAEALTLNAAPTVGTNIGATGQTDEPVSSCRTDSSVNSVWYSFVSTGEDMVVSTDFVTDLHDTYITIYTATDCADLTTFTEVGCDDDGGSGVTSFIQLSGLTAGDTYYVKVDGYSANVGEFNIQIATNDIMTGAIPIVPSPEGTACDADAATFTAHLAGDGTTDSGMDGSCNGTSTGLDRFFSWTATSIGLVWNDGNAGNPGIVIRDTDGNEIICEGTFADDDIVLSGWAINDHLIIQIYDYNDADVDVTFCLAEINTFAPTFTTTEVADCANNQFTVDVDVTSLGGASSVTISDNQSSATQTATITGVVNFGPYPNGTVIDFTVTSDDDATLFTTQTFTYNCPPPNDLAADAIAVACGDTVTGDTSVGATVDVQGDCGSVDNDAPNLWYSYTGSGSPESITASLCGSAYDTSIAIFTGTPGALVCYANNDDSCSLQSEVTFTSDGVQTYYIEVEGYNAASTGAFSLAISCETPCTPAVTNQDCASALAITIDAAAITSDNTCATTNVNNPSCDQFGTIADVWFSFVAPATGITQVSTTLGTATDINVVVYEGACGSLTEVAGSCMNTSDAAESISLTDLVAGDTYYVQAWNSGSTGAVEEGTFDIEITNINVSVPDCPTLVSPADGATDVFSPVTLDWDAAGGGDPADSYNLYISVNGGAEFLFANYTDTQAPPLGIQPGITVVWRVVPVNAAGENTTCTTSFTMSSVSETGDYDGDGINNIDEYDAGSDYTLPCDPVQTAGYTGYDATNAIWMAADCDGDGQTNDYEATNGSDPYDANSTASLEELAAVGFEFYPNPVNDNLTVKANENITSVAIFNMLGQQVKQVNPSSLNAKIDMTNLANGTYFIKATVGEKVGTFKIVKK